MCNYPKASRTENLLNEYKVDNNVKISINLRGREWINPEGKAVYFNTIQGWRIEKVTSEQTPTQEPDPIGNDSGLPF